MKHLLIIDIIFSRVRYHVHEFKSFLKNIIYFLRNINSFEKGHYFINSRVIIKNDYLIHDHFNKTTLSKKPKIKIYNKFGRLGSGKDMLGFHPDMYIEIDFKNKIVSKTFFKEVDLSEYSNRRNQLSKYVAAPRYTLVNNKKYEEELIHGRRFVLNEANTCKLKKLLNEFKDFTISSLSLNEPLDSAADQLHLISQVLCRKIDIDIKFFEKLLLTSKVVVSKGSDMAGANILETNDRLVLIDWEPKELKNRFFWTDAINLIIKSDPIGFVQGKYTKYLNTLLMLDGINTDDVDKKKYLISILCASFVGNLKNIHTIDLCMESQNCPCRGFSFVKEYHLFKVSRMAIRFMDRYAN